MIASPVHTPTRGRACCGQEREKYVKPFALRYCVPTTLLVILGVSVNPVFSAAAVAGPTGADRPTTQASRRAGIPALEIEHLRTVGTELARNGHFSKALDRFRRAAKLAPGNAGVKASVELLNEYVSLRDRMTAERAEEFKQAVARAERCLLVERHREALAEDGLADKLRGKLDDAASGYNGAGAASDLSEASAEKAKALRGKALKAAAEAVEAVKGALEILKDSKTDYADKFRSLVGDFLRRAGAYRRAWTKADLSTPGARRRAAWTLWPMEYDLAGALSDLESMTDKHPWRVALAQLRLAKDLAAEPDEIPEAEWYRKVIELVTARARSALKKKDWQEVLMAYTGLSELDPGDESLRETVRTLRRRVRIVNMYGRKPVKSSDGGSDEKNGVSWKEMVAGADASLVGKAIAQLPHHVSAVDYRKVANGALAAVKMLAEMPQVRVSFPKLKDDEKRKRFVEAIDATVRDIASRDRVGEIDLVTARNRVLSASEETVQIPTDVLAVEFADGMLDSLDRYSTMIWPYDVQEFQKAIRGSFVGVGIQITKEPKSPLRVVTPLDDTPAFRAGIKRGDLILAVDGRETADMHISRLIRMIMGKKGTKVVLRIKREGRVKPFDVTIVREAIKIRTVKGWQRRPDGKWNYFVDESRHIGYLRVTQFSDKTTEDVRRRLEALQKAGVSSLVLDLRFNPGGRLDGAIEIADEFLAAGRIISTDGASTRKAAWEAGSKGFYQAGSMVVLINQQSASAAEIVSGALQDLHRGLIVGRRSYGKGSVQKVYHLRWDALARSPVASLKLTTAYYYLPSKRLLHRKPGAKTWGVDPDILVRMTPKQMRRWLDIRYNTDILQDIAPEQLAGELEQQLEADLQLNTALMLLRLMELQRGQAVKQVVKKAA